MNNNKYILVLFITSMLFISCGESAKAQQNYPSTRNEQPWLDPNPNLTNEINSLITNKLEAINKCEKNSYNTNYNCETVEVSPGSEEINNQSAGKRVLIIDDKSMQLTAYTRYRKRVLENIHDDNSGLYRTETEAILIPRIAKEILLDIFYDDKYNKIPYELTEKSGHLFENKLDDVLENYVIGHGNYIFNYIANNSPNSQFVVAYKDSKFQDDLLSKNISESQKIIEIEKFFNNQAESLLFYIRKYDINFVTYSGGVDNNYLSKFNLSQNAKIAINKLFYNNFISKITNQSDIIFTQAAGSSSYFVQKNDSHFYSDCAKNDKRIRVGILKISDKLIPTLGSRNKSMIPLSTRNFLQCTDLYINMTNKFAAPRASTYGIGFESFPRLYLTSSFSTPVALSYLLYLKSINPNLGNNDVIRQVNILSQNEFVILDPSYNKQLPLFNLSMLN